MAIELEKILDISVVDYNSLFGIDLDEIVLVGVHVAGTKESLDTFLERVPEGAHRVIGFTQAYSSTTDEQIVSHNSGGSYRNLGSHAYTASGTALISREKYEALHAPSPIKEQ